MNKYLFLLLLIFVSFNYGCREKAVKYEDSGKTIHLMVDQVLKVSLPSDASTPNDWRKVSYNDEVLHRMGKPNYMLSDGSSGSPGMTTFKFKALQVGESKIYMEYGNKYKSEKEALKVFEIDIVIVAKTSPK